MGPTTAYETRGSGRSESVDEVCSLLADSRRRRLLRVLREHDDETIGFSELVTEIAPDGNDSCDTIAIELHHAHLPKAARAGVLEYDRRTREIRYQDNEIVDDVLGV